MKNFLKDNWFKAVAAIILFVGVGVHPYSYYEFLRWAVCVSAFYSAYLFYHSKNIFWVWVFSIIGILFNPIAPFYLSRSAWQDIDLITGVIFLVAVFIKTKKDQVSNQ